MVFCIFNVGLLTEFSSLLIFSAYLKKAEKKTKFSKISGFSYKCTESNYCDSHG